MRNCCYVNRMMYKSLVLSTKPITFISYKEVIQKLTLQIPVPCYSQRLTLWDSLKCQVPYFKSSTLGKECCSLWKHPFLLALHRWERFARNVPSDRARRNGCFRRLRMLTLHDKKKQKWDPAAHHKCFWNLNIRSKVSKTNNSLGSFYHLLTLALPLISIFFLCLISLFSLQAIQTKEKQDRDRFYKYWWHNCKCSKLVCFITLIGL